jgi:acetolactate synthase-1/2/3 large subunit
MSETMTVGEALIRLLECHGVEIVFGIPGVHTAELYRGLTGSGIRHVTPRDEQDAGFMADGYARASGKPGVCLLITGPGLTNAITPMAQARADSIPMLVISGVNALPTLGRCEGHLHELPDQAAMIRTVALSSERLERPSDLPDLVARAFSAMASGRPGPVHIEIPTDLMEQRFCPLPSLITPVKGSQGGQALIDQAAQLCAGAARPVILAGGGAVWAREALRALAEKLHSPVVTTANARGLMAGHPLSVPASPSLSAVRRLINEADLVIAIGTQFGPTDYDVYGDGGFKTPERLIAIDLCSQEEIASHHPSLFIRGDAAKVAEQLAACVSSSPQAWGSEAITRADQARGKAHSELSPKMQCMIEVLSAVQSALPEATLVGDSTQLAYAGNLFWEASGPRRWFNAATGYGALGYGPPAAVGAAIALHDVPVVCLVGDGGFQFCLGVLGAAKDEAVPVIFVVWNNSGYQEIEDYMVSRDITPTAVKPSAPDFTLLAKAYGIPAESVRLTESSSQEALAPGELDFTPLISALHRARESGHAALIEIKTP